MTQTLTPGRWRGLKTTSSRKNVFNILAFDQRGTYRKMLPPDYLVALEVSPDVSVQRKPDHQRATVEAKGRAIRALATLPDLANRSFSLIRISADQPLADVQRQLKEHIWRVLS